MRRVSRAAIVLALLLTGWELLAQRERLLGPIDNSRRTTLRGYRHPDLARARDQGRLNPARRIGGITFILKPSPEQQADLDRYLQELQDPTSPNYHNWLTPEEYADRFGLSTNDFSRIAEWLTSQGFQLDYQARARNSISFSGAAADVERVFRISLHRFILNSQEHFANVGDPSVPTDLAPFIQVIQGLDDFPRRRMGRVVRPIGQYTLGGSGNFVTPGDLAIIYNIAPLYQRGIDGSGQKIAVIGASNFNLSDVRAFRTRFGLASNDPQLVRVPGYADPGIVPGDIGEALLDVEYAGSIAPRATLVYVYATNVWAALAYAVDQDLAPVLSSSYGYCEPKISSNPANSAAAFRALAQQAVTQGMTLVSASGDSGAADCEQQGNSSIRGTNGPAVDLPASVPEVTGVGGSAFLEGSGHFWDTSNRADGSSALSYIPEIAWNETTPSRGLLASGGGASMFFSKPGWQTGTGVPSDNARDVPDVSFTSAAFHAPYLIVHDGNLAATGGTSAAAPTFAGILTLLNQAQSAAGARGGQGNINPGLYRLAKTNPEVFHDITQGDNIVPCTNGTTGCSTGTYGFNAGPGYDQVTGLGSVDADALVRLWGSSSGSGTIATSTSLAASPTTLQVNTPVTLTATVRAASGTNSPAGTVSFNLGRIPLGSSTLAGSGGTATASLTLAGSQLVIGANSITAVYGGSSAFTASSATVTVTVVVPAANSAVIPSITPSPVYQQDPDADGFAWFYTVRLVEIAGTASTLTEFNIGGADRSADIQTFFGSNILAANGTLSAHIRTKGLAPPVDRLFTFSGIDARGVRWTQKISVPFLSRQVAASMVLTSSPPVEFRNPKGDPHCSADYPYYQQLNLEERNGIGLTLTKFFAGGNDFSDQILDWFGTYRLAPLGALHADICWKTATEPTTFQYEVDGVDTAANKIVTTAAVDFRGPGQTAGALSISPASVDLRAAAGQSTTSEINLTVPEGERWAVSMFPANQKTSWLTVFPQSGTGPGKVNLVASAAGLPNGVYTATLVFQSANTGPQFLNSQVTFTIGLSSTMKISTMGNGASFAVGANAPGMLASVFGTRLANSTRAAASLPLPLNLDGVSATVNGIPAPLYFVSPDQINLQIPYETPSGNALLAINNNGEVALFRFPVKATNPGIFTSADGTLVPSGSAAQGQAVTMFVTGEGDTLPGLPTGSAPDDSTPVSQLPAPRKELSMTVGSVPVTPLFVGIPYGVAGVTQVNFVVPFSVSPGAQQVVITVNGISSKPAILNVTSAEAAIGPLAKDSLLFPLPGARRQVEDAPARR
jgi:uncharacterized protein (TIGR03437 family)